MAGIIFPPKSGSPAWNVRNFFYNGKYRPVLFNSHYLWPFVETNQIPTMGQLFNGSTAFDTGIQCNGDLQINCTFYGPAQTSNQYYMVFGVRPNSGDNNNGLLLVANTTSSRYVYQYGSPMATATHGTLAISTANRSVAIHNNVSVMTVGNSTATATVSTSSAAPNTTAHIWLGNAAQAGSPIAGNFWYGQITHFQIIQNSVNVLDIYSALLTTKIVDGTYTPAYGLVDLVSGRIIGILQDNSNLFSGW